jgi:coniferyl-aldehyde dehydrogenase
VDLAKQAWTSLYPQYVGHPDANSIITRAHFERLMGIVKEARERGVDVISLNGEEPDARRRHFPMMVVVDPPEDLVCMREEVSGPVVPVKPYGTIDEAIARINAGPNPLSAYIVTRDAELAERFVQEVLSGGAGVNTFGFQSIEPAAPFGGVGRSGIGCHSGREGFLNYSHTKTVYYQSDDNPLSDILRPPFGRAMEELANEACTPIE